MEISAFIFKNANCFQLLIAEAFFYPPKAMGKANFKAAVNSRLTSEIGSKNFQPRSSN